MEPVPGGYTDGMSLGWLHGATAQTKDYVRRSDSAFNEVHGVGPKIAKTSGFDPINSTIDYVHKRYPDIPLPVVKLFVKVKYHHRIKSINQSEVETKRQRDYMKDGHFNKK